MTQKMLNLIVRYQLQGYLSWVSLVFLTVATGLFAQDSVLIVDTIAQDSVLIVDTIAQDSVLIVDTIAQYNWRNASALIVDITCQTQKP